MFIDENGNALLTVEELTSLASKFKKTCFNRGDTIFRQGELGIKAYIILSGTVRGKIEYKETSPTLPGQEFSMGKGALLGEISLITGIPRTATVYTDNVVEALVLSKETFAHLLNLRPEIPEMLADLVAQRQEANRVMLKRLKHFDDLDISQKLDFDKISEHFQRIVIDILYESTRE